MQLAYLQVHLLFDLFDMWTTGIASDTSHWMWAQSWCITYAYIRASLPFIPYLHSHATFKVLRERTFRERKLGEGVSLLRRLL